MTNVKYRFLYHATIVKVDDQTICDNGIISTGNIA